MSQRRDAVRNRELLVAAAEHVFREGGAAAPLDLVARWAGVGRGTLYRHFPDRASLVAAVVRRRLDALEAFASSYDGADLLERVVAEICWFQLEAPGVMVVVRGQEPERDVLERMEALLSGALGRAREHGLVRDDVALVDVFTVVAMLDGVAVVQPHSPVPVRFERALALALRALRPADRDADPLPVPALAG